MDVDDDGSDDDHGVCDKPPQTVRAGVS